MPKDSRGSASDRGEKPPRNAPRWDTADRAALLAFLEANDGPIRAAIRTALKRWDHPIIEESDLYHSFVLRLLEAGSGLFRGFRGEGAFAAYLYRTVYHACIDGLRRERRRAAREIAMELGGLTMTALPEVMAALPLPLASRDLSLVLLREMGYKYREISDITGLNPKTVSVRLTRLRKRLRDALRETGGPAAAAGGPGEIAPGEGAAPEAVEVTRAYVLRMRGTYTVRGDGFGGEMTFTGSLNSPAFRQVAPDAYICPLTAAFDDHDSPFGPVQVRPGRHQGSFAVVTETGEPGRWRQENHMCLEFELSGLGLTLTTKKPILLAGMIDRLPPDPATYRLESPLPLCEASNPDGPAAVQLVQATVTLEEAADAPSPRDRAQARAIRI